MSPLLTPKRDRFARPQSAAILRGAVAVLVVEDLP